MRNLVKEKLRTGEPSVGTWVSIGHPDVSETLASLGFDWVVFDMEHAPLDIGVVQSMMQSMSRVGDCTSMVRVAWNDPVLIKRALDIGAYGLVIPWVNSGKEARAAVEACKYPPQGLRGFGPRRASLLDPDYVKTANQEVLIVAQIETETAIRNIDEIVSVEGVDACFIGPYDLTMSLGVFMEWSHPRFVEAKRTVLEACKRKGVAPGIHCNEESINEAIAQGFQFCALNDDDTFLIKGAKDCLKRVEGWKPTKRLP